MSSYTNTELLDCAKRELRMRRNVYVGLVQARRMSQSDADREIGMMEAIVGILKERVQARLVP